uniref:Ig-like domain-containing protein n=1 Tax=Leptobrachium leishanense TaxID=445787 RepID=A0A8C5QDP1_9ANUR
MWSGRGTGCWIALAVILNPIWKDTACNGDNPDYRITVQREVTVPEGLCVTVPCKFTVDRTKKLENAVGYWQQWRDSAPCSRASPCYVKVVSSKSSETLSEKKSNFHLPGNPDTGDCTLTINDAKTQDTGWYYFRIEDGKDAKLKWKYDSNILQVTVTGGDSESCETSYPLTVQEQVSVPEGQCVTISCSIKNKRFSPTARGYWRKLSPDHNGCYPIVATNNKSVTPSDKIQTFRLTGDLSDGDCSLTINDVNKQDTGTYEFKIEDGEYRWSYRNKHVNLQVTGTDSESWKNSYPLTVQEWVNVLEGQCVTISCSITNYKSFSPTARGYWRKLSPDHSGCYPIVATNNKSVTPSDKIQTFRLTGDLSDGDCSLTINDANKQDTGTYQFRIEDGEYRWSYRNKHVNLQVTGTDSESWKNSYPLTVQEWVNVLEGQCVTISCSITNYKSFSPTARGYWRKLSPDHSGCYPIVATNDKSVTPSDNMQNVHLTGNLSDGDCSLTINDANKQDAGTYQFRIEDGEYRWSYRDKHVNVQVTGCDSESWEKSHPLNVQEWVSVPEGQRVMIPCKILNKFFSPNARGYWRKLSPDHTSCYPIVATNDKIQSFGLTGNLTNGDCSLTLTDANKSDAGKYEFRIEDAVVRWSYRNKYLNLKVTELKSPEIILPEKLVAGENQTLTCRLPGPAKCPAYKTEISCEKCKNLTQRINTNNAKESNFTFIPSKDDHQKSITCTVTLPSGKSTQKSVTLNVEYAPSISGEFSGVPFNHSDTVNVTEGDNVTITFSIDSNPPAKVTWRRGQEREYMALGQVLVVIPAISRQQSGTYTCLAQNKHGNDTITFHVKVSFPGPSKIPITGQQSEISITNIVIGLVGITLGILCAILISKIVAKISGKPEPPRESAEDKPDSVYMNVHPTSQVAPVDDRRTALDFTDSNREQTQHYARIDFSKSSPNPHPRPETTETL